VATANRSVYDFQSKLKIMEENRKCLESELMGARTGLIRMESSMQEWKGNCEDLEASNNKNREDNKHLRLELSNANEIYKTLSMKHETLEERIRKKDSDANLVMRERDRLEREMHAEQKHLRLMLANAKAEIQDLRIINSKLQKERKDCDDNAKRIQDTTNLTIANLLEELKICERNLSLERRQSQDEILTYHSKVTELQVELEKTKESMEEKVVKCNHDKHERDHLLVLLKSECDKLKSSLVKNEERLSEVEELRQTDRVKLLKLRENTNELEKELQATRTQLEIEVAYRMRLDLRLNSDEGVEDTEIPQVKMSSKDINQISCLSNPTEEIQNINFSEETKQFKEIKDDKASNNSGLDEEDVCDDRKDGISDAKFMDDLNSDSVEDSIERTQEFIRQRLSARSKGRNYNKNSLKEDENLEEKVGRNEVFDSQTKCAEYNRPEVINGDFNIELMKVPKLIPPSANIVSSSYQGIDRAERPSFNANKDTKLPSI